MIETGTVFKRLHHLLCDCAEEMIIEEVCIGTSYVAVVLSGCHTGVAAITQESSAKGGTEGQESGEWVGRRASQLLLGLVGETSPMTKSLALATANAIINSSVADNINEDDTIGLLKLSPDDRVAMIGLFSPLVSRIRATGAELEIIERNPVRMKVKSDEQRRKILQTSTVVIITATTLLNGSMETVLNDLGCPRHVAVLGPSTPMLPDVFQETPVNHLGGSFITNREMLIKIISEGGGTPEMRPYLKFNNIFINGRGKGT